MYFESDRKYLLIIFMVLLTVISVTYFLARNLTSRYDNILGRSKYLEYYETLDQQ